MATDAVLFDLDDTLCEFVQSSEALLADSFAAIGVDPFFTLPEYQRRYSDYFDGCETIEDLRTACFADLAADRGFDPDTGRALAAVYSSRRDYSVEALPDASQVLGKLNATYALGLVTNGRPSIQTPKLDELPFTEMFDVVVFAGHETAPKPNPEPFHRALDQLSIDPNRAVFVGNSLDSDVRGANTAGLRSVWLTDDSHGTSDPAPDHVIGSLQELWPPPWEP